MMPEAVAALESLSGKKVVVLAPSTKSVEVLKEEGFARSETFQRFDVDTLLQNVSEGCIIWVDEAGFMSARQMRWLLEHALASKNRVILSGDYRQHHSVERGDALRVMRQAGAIREFTLGKIRRQKVPELLEAVKDLSEGRTLAGYDKLDAVGVVQEVGDTDERLEKIADLYMDGVKEERVSLVVAPTHEECREVAGVVRERLKEEGIVESEGVSVVRLQGLNWTESQRRDAVNYRKGDVVEWHRRGSGGFKSGQRDEVFESRDGTVTLLGGKDLDLKDAKAFQVFRREQMELAVGDTVRGTRNISGLKNNHLYKVVAVGADRVSLLDCTNGQKRAIEVSISREVHLDQGLVVTSFAAQGTTVDQVIVSAPVSTFSNVSDSMLYVAISRARYLMHLLTDSKAALRIAVQRSSERLSPSEIVGSEYGEEKIIDLQAGARKRRDLVKQVINEEKMRKVNEDIQRRMEP